MPIDPSAVSPRRSSRRVFYPLILVAVLAIGWTGFWWYASTRVQSEWDRFIVRQAEIGRKIECATQGIGGYPFRLEMRCEQAKVTSSRANESFTTSLGGLYAVAQVYQPTKGILEVKGPMVFAPTGGSDSITANWTSAQASLSFWTTGPRNADMVIAGLDASVTRNGQAAQLVSGANVEAHVRVAEGANAAPGAYDLVAKLDATGVPVLDAILQSPPSPVSGEFQGTITRIDLAPMPMPDRLRAWAANGGQLNVVLAQINRGPTSVKAAGILGLEPTGHPSGDLAVALSGVNELTDTLKQSGRVSSSVTSLLGVGLTMLGKPTNIDGKAAVEVPLQLSNGKMNIGAFPVGIKLPSVF